MKIREVDAVFGILKLFPKLSPAGLSDVMAVLVKDEVVEPLPIEYTCSKCSKRIFDDEEDTRQCV